MESKKILSRRLFSWTARFIIFLAILIVIVLLVYSSKTANPENMKYKKVLVIGIDGMDFSVTNQLIKQGKLPNFESLAKKGSFVKLKTSMPPHSPVAWTSIATGVNPGKHNIFDFIRRDVGSYLPELSLAKSVSGIAGTDYVSYVKSAPFWAITSENKIPSTVIRWPVTFPPEKVHGNLLSGLGVPDIKGLLSSYAYYTEEISQDSKIISVSVKNNIINTNLSGPKIQKSGELVDVTIPLKIAIDKNQNKAELLVNGNPYGAEVGKWSDWIRAEFKIGMLQKVSGIFKAYVISLEPFKMYVTTVQIDPQNPVYDISFPEKYSSELADEIGLYYTLGMPEETSGIMDGKIDAKSFLEQTQEIEAERDKMFWKEFENFKSEDLGLFAFVYDTSDRIQHIFWQNKILENKTSREINISREIEDYWTNKDKFIGKVLEEIDNSTLLLIVSDHGFTSFEKAVSINTWLVENDMMSLTSELDDSEHPLFETVDWTGTKAYSLGFNSIYINLKGREKNGIVAESEKEKVMNEIIKGLESLKDEEGNKVINKVYKSEEIYTGNYVKDAPDLVIGFNPGFRMSWQTAVGGFSKEVILKNEKVWSGDHLVDSNFVPGVLFSNIKFNVSEASQLDILPTVLDSFKIKIPGNIDGKSLL